MTRGHVLYLAVLGVVGAAALWGAFEREPSSRERRDAVGDAVEEVVRKDTVHADAVQGLWSRWPERRREGDPVRFYYFHGDGHGLYRYGRIGHTNTHSFDYRVEGDTVRLRFRKSGSQHELRYRIEAGRDGRRTLRLENDPEESGATTTYTFVPPPSEARAVLSASEGKRPAGRMWIDLQRYATGGVGFSLYQLGPAGIDGRGTGWHHRGDFDDWSTESLSYRLDDGMLELRFELTGERAITRYELVEGADGKRRLILHEDPRNWWHRASFADMGRAFAADISLSSPLGALLAPDEARARPSEGD